MIYTKIIGIALFLFCFAGCSRADGEAKVTKSDSVDKKVLESFKTVVGIINTQTNSEGGAQYSDTQYDVKKTDSIVSPYTGVLTFKRQIDPEVYDFVWTVTFAHQDGKWVGKSIDCEIVYSPALLKDEVKLSRAKKLAELTVQFEQSNLRGKLGYYFD